MRQYKYLLTICYFIAFFNCEEEKKTVFSEINITTENNSLVEVNIPEANGNKIVSNQINNKIQNTVISALHIGNPDEITSASIEESITAFNNEFKVFKTDFPESSQLWEAQIDGEIIHQSSELISIALTSYTNTGGAHGILNISFLNFDSKTGQSLKNNQLFSDVDAFKEVAKPYFNKVLTEKNIILDNTLFQLPANIGYTEDGIVLLYNTYEVAPYSDGIIEFAIPYDEVEDYLVFNSL
ncbi:DUF3298/DUF4163 domain-containing protein [Algibacter marinivivus]|uniref:DUF3298/DUF4163 domain-containing protein n=1 Tax=Algibacter marinivivus TaxID=2100723 RepID=A0A2U2X7J8_9FLAO|nr:DUF3298 and DUF4163 domain-containing protein [Algibacter marinivivus]PWH83758.1 DUF3298/DUF4163 domain-containing protein [Algibacter marinivivus]